MTITADAHIGDIWQWVDGGGSAVVLVIEDRNENYNFEGLTLHATGYLANRINGVYTWYPASFLKNRNYGWKQLA